MEKIEDDAPNIDTENGYWGLMFEGNHLTHVIGKTLLQEIKEHALFWAIEDHKNNVTIDKNKYSDNEYIREHITMKDFDAKEKVTSEMIDSFILLYFKKRKELEEEETL
jgi:hypothetical protein